METQQNPSVRNAVTQSPARPVAPPLDPQLASLVRDGVVVPWIGAGFSVPLGFPTMRQLLEALLSELHQVEFGNPLDSSDVPPHLAEAHEQYLMYARQLREGTRDYAEIASRIRSALVPQYADHRFYTALRNVLNNVERQTGGRASMGHYFLGLLGFRRIVTTNYDRLIERHVLPLASVVTGEDVASIDYYHRVATNDEVVFKIHGDVARPVTIPFDDDRFRALYSRSQTRGFVRHLIQNCSLLFMGTSLSRSEKYYDFLRQELEACSPQNGGVGQLHRHRILLREPTGDAAEREAEKRDKKAELYQLGVDIVWYQTNDEEHSQVYEYLANLAATQRPRYVSTISRQRAAKSYEGRAAL